MQHRDGVGGPGARGWLGPQVNMHVYLQGPRSKFRREMLILHQHLRARGAITT